MKMPWSTYLEIRKKKSQCPLFQLQGEAFAAGYEFLESKAYNLI